MSVKITPEILEAYIANDKATNDFIYSSNYVRVKNNINRVIKCDASAEDLAHDAFILLWQKREEIESADKLIPFLNSLARFVTFNYARNKRRSLLVLVDRYDISDYVSLDVESEYVALENELRFELEVLNLPEQQQKIFKMNKLDGLAIDEIAEELQVSSKTVRNNLTMATKQLKSAFYFILFFFIARFM